MGSTVGKAEINENLRYMSLPTLISDNCNEQRTCRIIVQNNTARGEIYLKSGNVVHAVLNDLIGEKAFHKIINLSNGVFKLYSNVESPSFTISKNYNKLLLESAQFSDEDKLKLDWSNFNIEDGNTGQKTNDRLEKFIKDLESLVDVTAVTIYYKQTKSFKDNANFNESKYGDVVINLINQAKQIGKLFHAVRLNYIILNNAVTIVIINYGLNAIILVIEKTELEDAFMENIRKLLKQYK